MTYARGCLQVRQENARTRAELGAKIDLHGAAQAAGLAALQATQAVHDGKLNHIMEAQAAMVAQQVGGAYETMLATGFQRVETAIAHVRACHA